MSAQQLTIIQPDDLHIHVRDGDMLRSVLPYTAKQFGRAIIMPNLKPQVDNLELVTAYYERIKNALPKESQDFTPLMTLYLSSAITPEVIPTLVQSGIVKGIKVYPSGVTTNSEAGLKSFEPFYAVFEAMQKNGLALLIHGEDAHHHTDIFDRESVFIQKTLNKLIKDFPELKIVLEHITTQDATEFVWSQNSKYVGATVTAHHLLMNRNALFAEGKIRPHHFCAPILKREHHRKALVRAVTSGDAHFFLGTDTAPHPIHAKETSCGCAGLFTAYNALGLYAEVFDKANKLENFEKFASKNGADFYGLPYNQKQITLIKEDDLIPEFIQAGNDKVVPIRAGQTIAWKVAE